MFIVFDSLPTGTISPDLAFNALAASSAVSKNILPFANFPSCPNISISVIKAPCFAMVEDML